MLVYPFFHLGILPEDFFRFPDLLEHLKIVHDHDIVSCCTLVMTMRRAPTTSPLFIFCSFCNKKKIFWGFGKRLVHNKKGERGHDNNQTISRRYHSYQVDISRGPPATTPHWEPETEKLLNIKYLYSKCVLYKLLVLP